MAGAKPRKKTELIRGSFPILAAIVDLAVIFFSDAIAALLREIIYRPLGESLDFHLSLCFLVSVVFVTISAANNDYAIGRYLNPDDQLRRSLMPWCATFALTLVVALVTGAQTNYRLLPTASLFVAGLLGVGFARQSLAYGVRDRAAKGRIVAKRLFLIGFEPELENFINDWEPHRFGMQIVAACVLRGHRTLDEDLALARAHARILAPDDVFILVPWSDQHTIDTAVDAFLGIPAAIQIGLERIGDRFANMRLSKIGPIRSLNIVSYPLSPTSRILKRSFDLVFATMALVALAPLMLMVAIAVKLDSPGPVLFRQRRYGFNQRPFQIFKFRSMTTCEDNSKLVQVTSRTDARLTRVGKIMRRYNIDELPQLFNVIAGDMSLVGPRPMAIVHDQMFEPTITLYARRHNVKPGITGWAQINGCRGGISEERIRARIEHDLYYIDHWSLWFDIKILWRTVASKEAYLDAF